MNRGYTKIAEMSTADLGFSLDEVRGRGLDEVPLMGAKLVLEVAMGEEVAEFLGRNRYDRADPARPGYRNGKRTRRVQVGSGLVEVEAPKVTGALLPFASEVLPAWKRRGEELEEAIVQLYAEGLSTRDFRRALGKLWGETGLSKSSVSRAEKTLHAAFFGVAPTRPVLRRGAVSLSRQGVPEDARGQESGRSGPGGPGDDGRRQTHAVGGHAGRQRG